MARPNAAVIQEVKAIARSMADAIFYKDQPRHVSQTVREIKGDRYKVDVQFKMKGGISNVSSSLTIPAAYVGDPEWKRKWILEALAQDRVPAWCDRYTNELDSLLDL